MLSSLSPARRRMALVLGAVLVAAVVLAVSVTAARRRGGDSVAATAPETPGPVLLIPGYGGTTSDLTVLADVLRRHGRDVRTVSLPDGGIGDLRGQAKALGTAVDEALKQTGRPSADLVGYSAGGVVARLYVRSYAGAGKVRRVVTLGSPQHGTQLAAAGAALGSSVCPLACQQLVPGSDLLAQLNQGRETPAGATFVSLWSMVDQTVTPPDSARLNGSLGMSIQSICSTSTVAHGDLPRNPLVTAIVAAELDGAQITQFGPMDCATLSS